MKLYQFDYFKGDKNPITMTERDAVEKPKIYEFEGAFGKRRIAKDSVNKIFSDYGTTVFLLEPNYEKAKEIILEALKKKLDARRKSVLELEKDCQVLARLSFSSKTEPLMTEEMYEELKKNVFFAGADAMVDILDHDLDFATDEEMKSALDDVLAQMPEEEAYEYYQKYCTSPTLGR